MELFVRVLEEVGIREELLEGVSCVGEEVFELRILAGVFQDFVEAIFELLPFLCVAEGADQGPKVLHSTVRRRVGVDVLGCGIHGLLSHT